MEKMTMRKLKKELNGNTFLVVSETVDEIYNFKCRKYRLRGESDKKLSVVENIIRKMIEVGCDRDTILYAVGGGSVGDVGGLVAGLYMRGISWVVVPTTLLAMADSSIGGKTAVNLDFRKNMIGMFYLPTRVLRVHEFLDTLNERQILSGYGEVIKTALLREDLYDLVRESGTDIHRNLDKKIDLCTEIKRSIVERDPYDRAGIREALNMGHTVGHAVEKLTGIDHGICVMYGLSAELHMVGAPKKIVDFVDEMLPLFGEFPQLDTLVMTQAALCDKKNRGGKICIVYPTDIGITATLRLSDRQFAEKLAAYENKAYT